MVEAGSNYVRHLIPTRNDKPMGTGPMGSLHVGENLIVV